MTNHPDASPRPALKPMPLPRTHRNPTLEIRLPISPTPVFFNMAQAFVLSLRRFGGQYANARVSLTIGDESPDPRTVEAETWIAEQNVAVHWVDQDLFATRKYSATGMERFRQPIDTDVVLIMDADMLVTGPIDEVVHNVHTTKSIAGMIAHVAPPFPEDGMWEKLFAASGLDTVPFVHEHTGWAYMCGRPAFRYCPPYFNMGFVCLPAETARFLGERMYGLADDVAKVIDTSFNVQLATSLAICKFDLPYLCLPMRYNFANDMHLEAMHPLEVEETRVCHILRNHQGVWKFDLFATMDSMRAFCERDDLVGVNAIAQRTMRAIISDLRCPSDISAPQVAR